MFRLISRNEAKNSVKITDKELFQEIVDGLKDSFEDGDNKLRLYDAQ